MQEQAKVSHSVHAWSHRSSQGYAGSCLFSQSLTLADIGG